MRYRTEEIEIRNDRQELLSKVYVSPYYTHYYPLLEKYSKIFMVYAEDFSDVLFDVEEKYNVAWNIKHMYEMSFLARVGDYYNDPNSSETAKNAENVLNICELFNEYGVDRDSLIVVCGGGAVLDRIGFAASIYRRGVDVAYVPTTLLAQVDASIGGKTAVNLKNYKNLIGTFKQPVFTYICPGVLKTLPDKEFRNGLAEMLKAFIIEDNGNYEKAVKMFSAAGENWADLLGTEEFMELLTAAVKVKAGIVGRDMYEKGERRKLNLGHTFAHAIEYNAFEKNVPISHGQAVSIGIILAARFAEEKDIAEPGLYSRLRKDFEACGLPTECPFRLFDLVESMEKDKKASGGKIHFVFPRSIGDVVIRDFTVDEAIDSFDCLLDEFGRS